MILFHKY